MMEMPQKYRILFYSDLQHIQPDAQTITSLLSHFGEDDFYPNTFKQLYPDSGKTVVRLRLHTPQNDWVIGFETGRINIENVALTPSGENLRDPQGFLEDACKYLGSVLKVFPIKAHRLSFITNGFAREMQTDVLDGVFKRFVKPIRFYRDNNPSEWSVRCVSTVDKEISTESERINVITQLGRTHGHFTVEDTVTPFDRMQISFDINTHQDYKETRFDLEAARSFYSTALVIRSGLLTEIEEQTGEGY